MDSFPCHHFMLSCLIFFLTIFASKGRGGKESFLCLVPKYFGGSLDFLKEQQYHVFHITFFSLLICGSKFWIKTWQNLSKRHIWNLQPYIGMNENMPFYCQRCPITILSDKKNFKVHEISFALQFSKVLFLKLSSELLYLNLQTYPSFDVAVNTQHTNHFHPVWEMFSWLWSW